MRILNEGGDAFCHVQRCALHSDAATFQVKKLHIQGRDIHCMTLEPVHIIYFAPLSVVPYIAPIKLLAIAT